MHIHDMEDARPYVGARAYVDTYVQNVLEVSYFFLDHRYGEAKNSTICRQIRVVNNFISRLITS